MRAEEISAIATELGSTPVAARTLAGGFSHETCLLTLAGGDVVVRLGGPDPGIEAAVMAGIAAASFGGPGFFTSRHLTVRPQQPWSEQLPGFAAQCMAATPPDRLDEATRRAWVDLCTVNAPVLRAVDQHSRLVHADLNPKNILVSRTGAARRWQVSAVLDWEFSHSGCPYADAANMARFGADYPARFLDGFRAGFAGHRPAGFPLDPDWGYLGRVLDMFALSDLVTRPAGHPVAGQAAEQIRRWARAGVPRSV